MMVDPGIIASLIVLIFLCFAIPIGGFIYLSVKKKHVAKPFFIGMLVFFVFQMVIRLPIIQLVLPQTAWFIAMSRNPWLYGLFMGGTAAITEELGRYIAVRFLLKKNRRYADGIAYGLGHGGIEAMLLIGVNNIANLFIILSGSSYMAALIAVQLNYATIYITLFERVLAIIVQVGLSILVFYAVRSEQLRYLIFALVIHTMIDAAIVILPGAFGVSVYWTEAVVFLAAVILMAWMVKIKPRFDPEGAFL